MSPFILIIRWKRIPYRQVISTNFRIRRSGESSGINVKTIFPTIIIIFLPDKSLINIYLSIIFWLI